MGGNTRSEMTVAYRHLTGIGTPRSCEDAVQYYKHVADKCISPLFKVDSKQSRIFGLVLLVDDIFLEIHFISQMMKVVFMVPEHHIHQQGKPHTNDQ
jgi:hypothetical protein